MARFHKIDGWRGYWIPEYAVAGASDTGTWSDSPANSDHVKAELARFQREALRPAGIKSRTRYGTTSNVFAAKRWIVVRREDFYLSREIAEAWLEEHKRDTSFIHDAR